MTDGLLSPEEFMARSPSPSSVGGNTPWAAAYCAHLREIIRRQGDRSPRNLQTTLGPSEIGEVCDRQVVGKFAGEPHTNHIGDAWPAIVGTAVHAWLADAFARENNIDGYLHWLTEQRVAPHPSYPGTADNYDVRSKTLVDWKVLGPTSLAKIMSPEGPSRRYKVQLLLYAAGYRLAGWEVDRIVLAALPRTAPTLDSMYVWEHWCTPADDILVSQVLAETEMRRMLAQGVLSGQISIDEIPITPTSENCRFCPWFRPESSYSDVPGCPGHSPLR